MLMMLAEAKSPSSRGQSNCFFACANAVNLLAPKKTDSDIFYMAGHLEIEREFLVRRLSPGLRCRVHTPSIIQRYFPIAITGQRQYTSETSLARLQGARRNLKRV
jgi:hypothetical protein